MQKAFRTGTSTRLDDRLADMCAMKTLPLQQLLRAVYPDLFPVHALRAPPPRPHPRPDEDDEPDAPDPPRLHLSAERYSCSNSSGCVILGCGCCQRRLVDSYPLHLPLIFQCFIFV